MLNKALSNSIPVGAEFFLGDLEDESSVLRREHVSHGTMFSIVHHGIHTVTAMYVAPARYFVLNQSVPRKETRFDPVFDFDLRRHPLSHIPAASKVADTFRVIRVNDEDFSRLLTSKTKVPQQLMAYIVTLRANQSRDEDEDGDGMEVGREG